MSSDLPPGWTQRESKSHPGKLYYVNAKTGQTTWDRPIAGADDGDDAVDEVQVLHILKKHNQSRRPSSWRVPNITQSKEVAIQQVQEIRQSLLKLTSAAALEAQFRKIASTESDCSSAQRGGDLGMFGPGQMQRAFEEVSFALPVGGLSDLVDSDSGIHVILRIK
jgi:peptidyl-prolyl cis-trans isomerase NIMA-interacting 1